MKAMKKLVAAFTLFCFSFCFIPNQARAAVPLALLAPAALGAAVLVAGGGTYYAPAVYQAGQVAADTLGSIGRKLYYTNNTINALAGGLVYGKLADAAIAVENVIGHIQQFAANLPYLAQSLAASWDDPPYVSGTVVTAQYGTRAGQKLILTNNGSVYSANSCYSPSGLYGYDTGGSWFWGTNASFAYLYKYKYESGSNSCYAIDLFTSATTANPLTPGAFNPATFQTQLTSAIAVHGPDVANEVDSIIANNPGLVTLSPGLTSAELSAQLTQLKADVAQKTADDIGVIADAYPTDLALQIEKLKAQDVAQEKAIDAAKEEVIPPSVPYTPLPLSSPYTLPEVDFGARLSQFFTALQATPLFALPATIFGGLPTDAGTSVLSFDGGQYGQHSFDFADLAPLLLILRAILFTCFAYISVRIVVLKR